MIAVLPYNHFLNIYGCINSYNNFIVYYINVACSTAIRKNGTSQFNQ